MTETRQFVVYGNGSVARLVYNELTYNSPHEVVAFCVDKEYVADTLIFGLPVVPFEDITTLYPPDSYGMFIGVGYSKVNKIRESRYLEAKALGYSFTNIIAKTVISYPCLKLGENCLIGNYTVIYPDVTIGNNVLVGAACTLDHDLILGDHCFLSDQVAISGFVKVMPNCFLGTSATVRNKVMIGRESIIGAATSIMEDVEERSVYLCDASRKLGVSSDRLRIV